MSVFANKREVSGKATPNKTIAAFPDVCMSPPSPPAGPVPIPYPVTSMASNTSSGTGSVKIKKKEVGKKNCSVYTKCDGNQPATNSFGAGVLTHVITGKTKFAAYSVDVLFEKSGAERFMDLTTSNHTNLTEAAPAGSIAKAAAAFARGENPCKKLSDANAEARAEVGSAADRAKHNRTMTNALYTPKGGRRPRRLRAFSTKLAGMFENGYCEGLTPGEKNQRRHRRAGGENKVNSRLNQAPECGDHTYKSADDNCPHSSHTEARIIEDIMRDYPAGGGKLIMKIDWPSPPPGKSSTDPCTNCSDLLCAACKCMEITLCDKNNKQKKPNCTPACP